MTDDGRNPSCVGEMPRINFTYNIDKHVKGKWFQNVWKAMIRRTLFTLHALILKSYYREAFEQQDERMLFIKDSMKDYMRVRGFDDSIDADRDHRELFNISVDLFLLLLKEDIYYRARFFDFVNRYRQEFELDFFEEENLRKWH